MTGLVRLAASKTDRPQKTEMSSCVMLGVMQCVMQCDVHKTTIIQLLDV
jgi:hypothetical protein